MEGDGGGVLRIVDGASIREALPDVGTRARRRFQQLNVDNAGSVPADQVRAAAEAEAAALLLGSELLGRQLVVREANSHLPEPSASDVRFDEAAFEKTLLNYLQAVADALREEPMVVSVLDGSVIRGLLEDEDEFAMAAENVFTELDVDNSGKLNRTELRSAVEQLVAEMGFPSLSGLMAVKPETDALVTKLLTKYAGQGNGELGQTQFAKLLQDVLQDLADSLASQPIVVVRDVKVLDGSYLRKVLDDEKLLSEIAEKTFKDLDVNEDGKLSKSEIRPVFESQAVQWGLPPVEESVEELYSEVFKAIDEDKSGDVDKQEFQVLMRAVFESFALQLKLNPILVDVETAAQ